MSLLAQLFRHKDASPADGGEAISLGAVAAALESKMGEGMFTGMVTEPEAVAPVEPPAAAPELAAHPPAAAAVPGPELVETPAAGADAVESNISATAAETPAAPGEPYPSSDAPVAAPGHSIAPDEAAVAREEPPITSDELLQLPTRGAVATETADVPPVILAPRVMELAPGAPPPVFLVPVGFTPPVLPTWTDEAAPAAAEDEAHANH